MLTMKQDCRMAVSYTHLDVYKRQTYVCVCMCVQYVISGVYFIRMRVYVCIIFCFCNTPLFHFLFDKSICTFDTHVQFFTFKYSTNEIFCKF